MSDGTASRAWILVAMTSMAAMGGCGGVSTPTGAGPNSSEPSASTDGSVPKEDAGSTVEGDTSGDGGGTVEGDTSGDAGGTVEGNPNGTTKGCGAVLGSEARIDAHLGLAAQTLVGSAVTFCRNGACSNGTFATVDAPDAGGMYKSNIELTGALDGVTAWIVDELDGYVEVEFSCPVEGVSAADGDVYSVTVADASGNTLLNVSRPVIYDMVITCQSTSDQLYIDWYPTSASGLECTDNVCKAGAEIEGTFDTTNGSSDVDITLCRNGTACASGTFSIASLTVGSTQLAGDLVGEGTASVIFQKSASGIGFDIQTTDDTAALADGDVYALTITQGSGTITQGLTTLVDGQATATYTVSYPNGMPCDAVPCRTATLMIQ